MSEDWLARWRSWVDEKPPGWQRNLWGEFFALLHRRNMWHGFEAAYFASPKDAQNPGRWLRQWVLRNHLETQAVAIRRIADRSTAHKNSVAFGRLLDEIAAHPTVLGADLSAAARPDADALESEAEKVTTFATKVVAHLDSDHAAASDAATFGDFDRAIDITSKLWEKWYSAITGKGVWINLSSEGWENVIRLRHRNLSLDNPPFVVARIVYELGRESVEEIADTLARSKAERVGLISRLYADGPEWLADLFYEMELESDDRVRESLAAEFKRVLP